MRLKWLENTFPRINIQSKLIIVSHSARALAESATRAGYDVVTVDGFADLDTLAVCREAWCIPLENGEFVESKLQACIYRLLAKYPEASILLGAGAEHLVRQINNSSWTLCGSSEAIEYVIDTQEFFSALDWDAIPYPKISFTAPVDKSGWLYKRPNTCGGLGVTRSHSAKPGYWQKEINGEAISALCIADSHSTKLLGVNFQLTDAISEDLPYVYQGAIANHVVSDTISLKLISYINKLRDSFNIIGVFSVDMILSSNDIYVLEINPRVAASFELYEQINPGLNLVDAHIRVCEGEALSKLDLSSTICAYQIIFADRDLIIPKHMKWSKWIKDIPEAQRKIRRYEPICSVFAQGPESKIPMLLKQRSEEVFNNIYQ